MIESAHYRSIDWPYCLVYGSMYGSLSLRDDRTMCYTCMLRYTASLRKRAHETMNVLKYISSISNSIYRIVVRCSRNAFTLNLPFPFCLSNVACRPHTRYSSSVVRAYAQTRVPSVPSRESGDAARFATSAFAVACTSPGTKPDLIVATMLCGVSKTMSSRSSIDCTGSFSV